jgi:hypothetical protein
MTRDDRITVDIYSAARCPVWHRERFGWSSGERANGSVRLVREARSDTMRSA